MKFLELHYPDGNPVLVNLENAKYIQVDDFTEGSKKSLIYFNGASDDWVRVLESYNDIVNAIKENW